MCLALAACSRSGGPPATLAIVDATIYAFPDSPPVQHGTVLIAGDAAADLVVLARDPAGDPTALADVRATIVAGKVVYEAP